MFGAKADIFCQAFIKSQNLLVLGFGSGIVRLIDVSDIKAIEEEDSQAITILDTFESGIRRLLASENDDFLAIGTNIGMVHLYIAKDIKKGLKYHEYRKHNDQTWDMAFIKTEQEDLFMSTSKDGSLSIASLETNEILIKYEKMCNANSIFQMFQKDDKIILRTNGFKLYEFEFYMDRHEKARKNKGQISYNLTENAKKTFLNSKDPMILRACLEYIPQTSLVLKNMNLASLAAYRGNSEAL